MSSCLLIVSNSVLFAFSAVLIFNYPIVFSGVFWSEVSSFAVSIMFNILSLLGGVQALARTRLVFAVFGTSILIPSSLSAVTFTLTSLARSLTDAENLTLSVYTVLFLAIYPVVLVLSVLSLIFLARSRHEFR